MASRLTPEPTSHGRVWALLWKRSLSKDVLQGVLIGLGLSILLIEALLGVRIPAMMTTVNGWQTTQACGVAGDPITQAACAQVLPAINAPNEAMYWQATVDDSGAKLDGAKSYVLHFAKGGLPPANAFWSITMAGANRLMAANPAHKYSVSDRSGVVPNADGTIDLYLRTTAPPGRQANWLPTPSGNFMLWLRAYQPASAILDGTWQPPAIEVAP